MISESFVLLNLLPLFFFCVFVYPLIRRSSWPFCGFCWSSSSLATWPFWSHWACPALANRAWTISSNISPLPVRPLFFLPFSIWIFLIKIKFFERNEDLSVGVISVLTDIVWKITVAWHAGNIACKVIRFSQVSFLPSPVGGGGFNIFSWHRIFPCGLCVSLIRFRFYQREF